MLVGKPRINATRPVRRSARRLRYWMIANRRFGKIEALTEDPDGRGEGLPVFRFRDEAEMFLWLRGLGGGWEIRETTAGELVSLLYGPCADVGRVIFDPQPRIGAGGSVEPESVDRKKFVRTVMGARSFGVFLGPVPAAAATATRSAPVVSGALGPRRF
jgi:hypothetical protein